MHVLHALADGTLLGVFMLSGSTFAVLVFHPDFLGSRAMPGIVRRSLMGIAMGATAAVLIYSPLGTFSGAHMNPSVTLAFATLGKVHALQVLLYITAQSVLGTLGMKIAHVLLGEYVEHEAVSFVMTRPGRAGPFAAARVEFVISFVLFLAVLFASNYLPTHSFTGLLAGALVAVWIALFAPISGMSMNPARTLASAIVARKYTSLWVYLIAPPLGMQAAALTFDGLHKHVFCAKMCHVTTAQCPFECNFAQLAGSCDSCEASRQQIHATTSTELNARRQLRCP